MKDLRVFLAGCPTAMLYSLLTPDVSLYTWYAMWRRKECDSKRFLFPSYSPSAVFLSVQRIMQDAILHHRTPTSQMYSLGNTIYR